VFNFGKTAEEIGRLSAMDENFAIISFEPSGKILNQMVPYCMQMIIS